ncbi:MAG: UPF0262 family protein [Pseudomonadota bacterium]
MSGDGDHRIVELKLDREMIRWNPDVQREIDVAIFDLKEANRFRPLKPLIPAATGPYHAHLAIRERQLLIDLFMEVDLARPVDQITLATSPFRRVIREYFAICESYYAAIKDASPAQIEAIDMGRRGLHNDGSETLRERLAEKVEMDFDTARRMFTLLCALHLKA